MQEAPIWLQVVFGLIIFFVVAPLFFYLVILTFRAATELLTGFIRELLLPMVVIASGVLAVYMSLALGAWLGSYVLFQATSCILMSDNLVDVLYTFMAAAISTLFVGLSVSAVILANQRRNKGLERAPLRIHWRYAVPAALGVYSLFWITFHFQSKSTFALW